MKAIDGMLGLAVGDAMGVPIKFSNRETLLNKPITKMNGYGNYNVPKGNWSGITSLSLATMDSFTKCLKIDYNDLMKRFCKWINDGKYSSCNVVFDINEVTKVALTHYYSDLEVPLKCGLKNITSNDNGSLMRMYPVAYFCYMKHLTEEQTECIAITLSSLTHAHPISCLGCYLYIMYIIFILKGYNKLDSYYMLRDIDYGMFKKDTLKVYKNILNDDIALKDIDDIKSTNSIVDTLEASLWVILNTTNYHESIIASINLGGDTNTIGAITGSMAGLLYGSSSIPIKWINELKNISFLQKTCSKFEAMLME